LDLTNINKSSDDRSSIYNKKKESRSNNNHNGSISTNNIDSTLLQYDEKHATAGNISEHHQDCLIFNRCSLHKRNVICIFVLKMMDHMSMITHDVFLLPQRFMVNQ
jgi:hypothetical protein